MKFTGTFINLIWKLWSYCNYYENSGRYQFICKTVRPRFQMKPNFHGESIKEFVNLPNISVVPQGLQGFKETYFCNT